MATSIEFLERDGRCEIRGALYHGIPCRIGTGAADPADVRAAWRILERIDDVFNVHRDDSELGAINAAGPGVHRLSPWLAGCLATARRIEAISDGAWCATMLPLVRLWRAAAGAGGEPEAPAIADARAACASDAWEADGERLQVRRAGVAFDLGGLAKGYAVDLVVAHLCEHGVRDFLVQVGGETACRGSAPAGGPHRIGIPHPDDPEGSWCAVLRDPGAGLCGSTSGDYRLGFTVAGRRRHHIMDPRSGRPAEAMLASVTCAVPAVGGNALLDGISTAASVLGAGSLMRLATAAGCEVLALRRDCASGLMATATRGWHALVEAEPSPDRRPPPGGHGTGCSED